MRRFGDLSRAPDDNNRRRETVKSGPLPLSLGREYIPVGFGKIFGYYSLEALVAAESDFLGSLDATVLRISS